MKVLVLYDHSGPKYWRLLLPCLLMPGVECVVAPQLTNELLADCDILYINRAIGQPLGMSISEMINNWRAEHGFKLIVDFDDHWELGKDHILHGHYQEKGLSSVMLEYLKIADAVTVTHERLADEVRPHNPNVHILPNAIPFYDQFAIEKEKDEKIRLFWAGSITHREDLELLRRPLQLIKRDKVKFVLGGFQKGNRDWFNMAKLFTTDSSYNTEVLESLPVERYYAMYSKCDIALIPLIDNKFNRNKSNLKVLEAANNGSPVIVSRVHPYLDFPEELVNYVDLHNTWYSQIRKLTDNYGFAVEQGQALKEYCQKTFNFNQINLKRKKLFDETIQSGSVREIQDGLHEPERIG